MLRRLAIARFLVTLSALVLAIVPPFADLNATHVTNELWPAHARLHTVWLVFTNSVVALLAVGLMWREQPRPDRGRILLGTTLVGAVLLGFFVAAATQGLYGGALADPNGVPFRIGPVDANLAVFTVCAGILAVATGLAWSNRGPSN